MPGGGTGATPDEHIHTEEKDFTGVPGKLVSGLLIVNVRNTSDTDLNKTYSRNWDTVLASPHDHSPNSVSEGDGIAPFYPDDQHASAANAKPPSFPTEEIFDNGVYEAPILTVPDQPVNELVGSTYGPPVPVWPNPKITGRKYTMLNASTARAQQTTINFYNTVGGPGGSGTLSWFGDDGGAGHVGRHFYIYSRYDIILPASDGAQNGGVARTRYNEGKYKVWFQDTNGTNSTEPPTVGTALSVPILYDSSTANFRGIMTTLRLVLVALDDAGGNDCFASVSTAPAEQEITAVDAIYIPRLSPTIETCSGAVMTTTLFGSAYGWNYGTGAAYGGADSGLTAIKDDKKLGIGDYDCYLFYVTMACVIDQEDEGGSLGAIPWSPDGVNKLWHHDKCQSFIKSHLIGRINNAADTNAFMDAVTIGPGQHPGAGAFQYLGGSNYREGLKRVFETIDGRYTNQIEDAEVTTNFITKDTKYLFNNGIYSHAGHLHGVLEEDGFGIDLSADHTTAGVAFPDGLPASEISFGSNSFNTPVERVQIGVKHGGPNSAGAGHLNSYSLNIKVHMYGVPSGADNIQYTPNRANIIWMPWGESPEITDP